MMKSYKVTVRAVSETEGGAFAGLTRYDEDAWFEPAGELADPELEYHLGTSELEVYEVHGTRSLDWFFDNSDGVVDYKEIV